MPSTANLTHLWQTTSAKKATHSESVLYKQPLQMWYSVEPWNTCGFPGTAAQDVSLIGIMDSTFWHFNYFTQIFSLTTSPVFSPLLHCHSNPSHPSLWSSTAVYTITSFKDTTHPSHVHSCWSPNRRNVESTNKLVIEHWKVCLVLQVNIIYHVQGE